MAHSGGEKASAFAKATARQGGRAESGKKAEVRGRRAVGKARKKKGTVES
jgi:hypothetical protein